MLGQFVMINREMEFLVSIDEKNVRVQVKESGKCSKAVSELIARTNQVMAQSCLIEFNFKNKKEEALIQLMSFFPKKNYIIGKAIA